MLWETSLKLSFLAFSELKEALDNLDVPEDKVRRIWAHRTEKSDTNWETIRSEFHEEFPSTRSVTASPTAMATIMEEG